MLSFDGEICIIPQLDGEMSIPEFEGEMFVGQVISSETHETYTGTHTVTPQVDEEVILETADKIVEENITVLPIPYYEVSNLEGTTVVIGG